MLVLVEDFCQRWQTAKTLRTHWWVALGALGACTPPSLRNAHSLDKGDFAVEVVGGLDRTVYGADIITLDSETTVTTPTDFAYQATGDVLIRAGLGKGFEAGLSLFAASIKYSVLDERRHASAPISLALNLQAGANYAGAGLLMSRHMELAGFGLRPVANVWFQRHDAEPGWQLPPATVSPELEVLNPGSDSTYQRATWSNAMYGFSHVTELAVPLGIEVPVPVTETYDLVPFVAYALSFPTAATVDNFWCDSCLVGVESTSMQRRSFLWAGVKFQPQLVRPDVPTENIATEAAEGSP